MPELQKILEKYTIVCLQKSKTSGHFPGQGCDVYFLSLGKVGQGEQGLSLQDKGSKASAVQSGPRGSEASGSCPLSWGSEDTDPHGRLCCWEVRGVPVDRGSLTGDRLGPEVLLHSQED